MAPNRAPVARRRTNATVSDCQAGVCAVRKKFLEDAFVAVIMVARNPNEGAAARDEILVVSRPMGVG